MSTVVSCMVPPPPKKNIFNILIPGTCDSTLFGKKVLSDVIKNLGIRELTWVIWMGPKSHHKCLFKREAEVDYIYRGEVM